MGFGCRLTQKSTSCSAPSLGRFLRVEALQACKRGEKRSAREERCSLEGSEIPASARSSSMLTPYSWASASSSAESALDEHALEVFLSERGVLCIELALRQHVCEQCAEGDG